ncbi:hypothetical protein CONLIGDRAFT_687650 [Coniochaeta ligniaria NRRL 30616]|uniref:Uncharacterized protein n=1 Tax=Coniochaeta ligniaria NRRL 30616 TaxID=1408157 RepID=A0A1J7IXM9_9PEZI|nr:hypothetical protein CONLIGDRAFT_687650 [Coniochaeta ligniaria NRRL 30616]
MDQSRLIAPAAGIDLSGYIVAAYPPLPDNLAPQGLEYEMGMDEVNTTLKPLVETQLSVKRKTARRI